MSCIGHAFTGLHNLVFHGDVHRFQSDFLGVKRELDTTGATITRLIVCQLMKAFEGKSKTVQFKIAEDFNKMDVGHPDINLYDMVQGYCADVATVGDSKPHSVGVVVCTVCQSETHESAEYPTRKQLAREPNEANRAKKISGGAPGGKPRRTNPSHAHLTCHSCQKLGHISPNCPESPDKALLAAHAQVLAVQALPTSYAPLVTHNATGALPNAMSEEQACLIAQNILNSLDSLPPAPACSPPAYASAPALCVTNTAPLSPQVLVALVSQLRTGSKSLLVRTVAVGLGQQCTGKGESVEDMVTRSVEALFAEESLEKISGKHTRWIMPGR